MAKGANSVASYHGTTGPVQVTYPDLMYGGPEQPSFVNASVSLMGIAHYKDLNGGTPNCVSITPLVYFVSLHLYSNGADSRVDYGLAQF